MSNLVSVIVSVLIFMQVAQDSRSNANAQFTEPTDRTSIIQDLVAGAGTGQKKLQLQVPYQEPSDELEELEPEHKTSTIESPKILTPGDYIRGTLSDLFRQAVNSPTDLGIVIAREVNELFNKITNTNLKFEIKPKSKPTEGVANSQLEVSENIEQMKSRVPEKIRSTYDLIQVVLG